MGTLTRREALVAGLAATVALLIGPRLGRAGAQGAVTGPLVRPRSDWAAGLAPAGPLEAERPEDVRFLLVHHSVSSNDYAPEAVPELLRSYYRLHTAKGWPDIAYNFLVDRFGGVWEGRQGSTDAPVKGDATGGSQGFALLCCFIGDHQTQAPSPAAQETMVGLLAWLADRYRIDPRPGATVTFTSRGSNRWPAGASVTTSTIAGHRDMSRTACPGDAAYVLVKRSLPERAAARLGLDGPAPSALPAESAPTTTPTAPPAPASPKVVAPTAPMPAARQPPTPTSTSANPTPTSTSANPTTTMPPPRSEQAAVPPVVRRRPVPRSGGGGDERALVGAGAAGLAVAGGFLTWLRRRRTTRP